LFFLTFANVALAQEEIIEKESNIDFGMNFRSFLLYNDNYDFPLFFEEKGQDDTTSHNIFRLTMSYKPTDWFHSEAHILQSFIYNSDVLEPISEFSRRYRAKDLSWEQRDHNQSRIATTIDRLNATFIMPKADLTIGRQPISFGKAFFWNPLDIFSPFDPAQLDRDYKAGVDAARLDIPLGNFSGINLITVAGREPEKDNPTWDGSAAIARGFTNVNGWDLSVQGGKIFAGEHIGAGFSGEIEKIEFRGEIQNFYVDNDYKNIMEDYSSGVLGIGYNFDNTINIQAEYFYNGAGEPDNLNLALDRMQQGFMKNMSRNLAGLSVSYDITPVFISRISTIVSLDDDSYQIQPDITYGISDNIDFIIAAIINRGNRPIDDSGEAVINSEFGTYPDIYFAELKVYF
jgi:hypothetical protein